MTHFSIAQATALVSSMEGQIPLPTPVDDKNIAEFMTNAVNQNNPAAAGISTSDEQETLIAHLNALPPESAAEVFDKVQFFWHYSPWEDTEFGLAQAHLIEWIDWDRRRQITFDLQYPNLPTAPYHFPEDPGLEEWERCERLRHMQKRTPEWKEAEYRQIFFVGGRIEWIRIPHPWNIPDEETTAKQIATIQAARTAAEASETAVETSVVEPAGFRKWIATRLPPKDECIAIALDVIKSVCLVILIGIAITLIYVLCLIIAQAAAEPTTLLIGALGIKGGIKWRMQST